MAQSEFSQHIGPALKAVRRAVDNGQISAGGAENLIRWLSEPHYSRYVPSLLERVEAGQWSELETLFWEVIPFGTGGRRGPMAELGSATINERTIAESAAGLAAYLRAQKPAGPWHAAVGYDTRHHSSAFARLTACTLAAQGLTVHLFEGPRATPELSFAVRHLGCDVGVMISASHNPPADNGFKAYWTNGGQVLPPHDQGIIECVYAVGEIATVDFDQAIERGQIVLLGENVDRAYVEAVASLSLSTAREIPVLYTPLHGVGESSIVRVLSRAGFPQIQIFEPQRTPDGGFPNVPDHLPNPERAEVFAPAVAHAKTTGARLVLASDPDADRLGVAVRGANGEFVSLSGNRIGALLVDYVLGKRSAAGSLTPEHYVVETIVTTPQVAAVARRYDVRVIDDLLVGFKYIAETMDREGPDRFVFGAEESLGYLAGDYCRDKDAAIAALYLLELSAELARDGRTLLDRLDDLFALDGYFTESQRSATCPGPRGRQQIDSIMRALRETPPGELAGFRLSQARDYSRHEVRSLPDNEVVHALPHPRGNLLMFDGGDGAMRLTIAARPSGTEPKIKFYFFAQRKCASRNELQDIKTMTDQALGRVTDAVTEWIRPFQEGT